jgi:hypothetical protein
MLTASVVGPKPVPIDWILQAALCHPQSGPIALDHLPEFRWLVEKIKELFLRVYGHGCRKWEMYRPRILIDDLCDHFLTSPTGDFALHW